MGDLSGKFGGFSSIPHVSTFVDTTGSLALFGRYGIIGRSIRIHGTENVCANILSSTEMNDNANVVYLQATFVYPFGGTIYMRQVETEDVIIWGKVYWVTDAVATTEGHNWHIHAYLVSKTNIHMYICIKPTYPIRTQHEGPNYRCGIIDLVILHRGVFISVLFTLYNMICNIFKVDLCKINTNCYFKIHAHGGVMKA